VLLLGAPGAGKGTQAQVLMAEFAIPQISTGDLLRANIASGTELGLKAKGLMSQGQFVDDETVNSMVAERLTHSDAARGYVLDGFPRTLPQADWLDQHLASAGSTQEAALPAPLVLPVIAVSINVAYDHLLQRITGRRTCPACNRSYNIYSQPPLKPGICDVEGAALQQRPDDTKAVFAERMKTFNAQTAHVIDHYRRKGRFEEVDGDQPVEVVTAAIKAALRRLRGQEVPG
jgi:adenylate kinase